MWSASSGTIARTIAWMEIGIPFKMLPADVLYIFVYVNFARLIENAGLLTF